MCTSASNCAAPRAAATNSGRSKQQAGFRQRGDRETVPRGDDLVVAPGPDPGGACGQESGADGAQPFGIIRVAPVLEHRTAPLERAGRRHAEHLRRVRRVALASRLGELRRRPDVEPALRTLAVRVERGRESALGGAQLADHPVAGLRGDAAGEPRARAAPQVRVDAREQRIVVEHLLEVRHHPRIVHGVPRETPAKLVVHAAARHCLRGRRCHPQRGGAAGPLVVAQQEFEHHRRRELGRAAEPAVHTVEVPFEGRHGGGKRGAELVAKRRGAWRREGRRRPLGERRGDPLPLAGDPLTLLGPRARDRGDQALEGLAREIGAAEERLAVPVMKTVIGQPPWPVIACVAVM